MKTRVISKVGNTHHPKYGRLDRGMELDIDEADFAGELFKRKRPPLKEGGAAGGAKPAAREKKEG